MSAHTTTRPASTTASHNPTAMSTHTTLSKAPASPRPHPVRVLARVASWLMLSLLALPLTTPATAQVAMTGVPFLNIEPDARATALGNTGAARIDGANAAFWNPGLLGFQSQGWLSLNHSNWLPGVSTSFYHDYLSLSSPVGAKGALAVDVNWFNMGEQLATDEQGNELGSFTNAEIALAAAYGHRLSQSLSLGLGVRYLRSSLGGGYAIDGQSIGVGSALAGDLGLAWRSGAWKAGPLDARLTAGLALSNLGGGISYMDGQAASALPSLLRAGWSLQLAGNATHRIILTNDVTKSLARMDMSVSGGDTTWAAMGAIEGLLNSWSAVQVFDGQTMRELGLLGQFTLGAGVEYWFQDLLALRGGYYRENPLNGDRQLLSLGAGVQYAGIGVDFSYLASAGEDHPMANTMRFSLKVGFPGLGGDGSSGASAKAAAASDKDKTKDRPAKPAKPAKADSKSADGGQAATAEPAPEQPAPPAPQPQTPASPLQPAQLAWLEDGITLRLGDGPVALPAPQSNAPGRFIYTIADPSIADLMPASTDQVIAKAMGTTTITASLAASTTHTAGSVTTSLSVRGMDPKLTTPADVSIEFSQDLIRLPVPLSQSSGAISCSAQNPNVIRVDNCGQAQMLREGSTLILISQAGDGQYEPAQTSYRMTVGQPAAELGRELRLQGVNFQSGSAVLTDGSTGALNSVVASLEQFPEVRLQIQGHTDSVGDRQRNLALSQARAEAVMAYFVAQGIDASRLSAVGFGPDQPVADNATPAGRAQNRRVVLVRTDQ